MITAEAYIIKFCSKTLNGRVYPRMLKDSIIEQIKDKIVTDGGIRGEFPRSSQDTVSLDNISHRVDHVEYDKDNNAIKCRFEIYDTPKGKEVQKRLTEGLPVYPSIYGTGIVADSVVVDFDLTKIDLHTTTAFPSSLMRLKVKEK